MTLTLIVVVPLGVSVITSVLVVSKSVRVTIVVVVEACVMVTVTTVPKGVDDGAAAAGIARSITEVPVCTGTGARTFSLSESKGDRPFFWSLPTH